jgi:hypothetical protein
MKNFYDSTVIKPTLTLDVVITLTPVGQCPCIVLINDKEIYNNKLTEVTVLQHSHSLTDPLTISIIVVRINPEAVVVDITVDGLLVIPLYQHLANPPTNYINSNDTWSFSIPSFYPWYHEITGQGWIA